MAKITKFNNGTVFYDAFGGKLGQGEVEYAGDAFDRSSVYACSASAIDDTLSATNCATNAVLTINADGIAYAKASTDKYNSSLATMDCVTSISNDVTTITEELEALKAQIAELSQIKIKTNNFRKGLKTLNYQREVE